MQSLRKIDPRFKLGYVADNPELVTFDRIQKIKEETVHGIRRHLYNRELINITHNFK